MITTCLVVLVVIGVVQAVIEGLVNVIFGDRWMVFEFDRHCTMVLMENTYTPSSAHSFKFMADHRAKQIEKKGGFAIVNRNLQTLLRG